MGELFEGWNKMSQQFTSIILTTIVICTIAITYNVKIRGHKEGERISGFLVLIEMLVSSVENLVVSIMGTKYRKLTPYALYIILYIIVSSLISLLGVESATTSYTVTLSMGLVTFFGIYYFGFKYQKMAYFKKYINPIEIFTQFTPLVSISFRLFGNLLGGSIILGLLYSLSIGIQAGFSGNVSILEGHTWLNVDIYNSEDSWDITWKQQYIYFWSGFNIFTTLVAPMFHMYFDLFEGSIQAVVFTMLTLSYWSEAMGEEESEGQMHVRPEVVVASSGQIEMKRIKKTKKQKQVVL
ncbi:F0F1 ATP synthase subunit A [Williamsoniiplasma somnilux]|uniref:F0F1 ATP synthase subunit A n=1 Tax=Williamsoniiplasma somnilux TaxID=215578 RepID=A0A2K8P0T4_9MOLU|nr:F0F1 ATP synthase subunit A [Williamsoniiplasma somnilux]ATZ19048.1 F0F1 ATP synthase subunit A [Williamsoniiplasma somnilux]